MERFKNQDEGVPLRDQVKCLMSSTSSSSYEGSSKNHVLRPAASAKFDFLGCVTMLLFNSL